MALLTIPEVTKGTPATITLDKTTLFAISAIAGDEYFSVQGNVDKCVIEYRSSPGKQKRRLVFDLSDPSPTASLLVPATGRSSFVISKIILVDFDNDTLSVPSAQIPSGLGISVSGSNPPPPPPPPPSVTLSSLSLSSYSSYVGESFSLSGTISGSVSGEVLEYRYYNSEDVVVQNGVLAAIQSTGQFTRSVPTPGSAGTYTLKIVTSTNNEYALSEPVVLSVYTIFLSALSLMSSPANRGQAVQLDGLISGAPEGTHLGFRLLNSSNVSSYYTDVYTMNSIISKSIEIPYNIAPGTYTPRITTEEGAHYDLDPFVIRSIDITGLTLSYLGQTLYLEGNISRIGETTDIDYRFISPSNEVFGSSFFSVSSNGGFQRPISTGTLSPGNYTLRLIAEGNNFDVQETVVIS